MSMDWRGHVRGCVCLCCLCEWVGIVLMGTPFLSHGTVYVCEHSDAVWRRTLEGRGKTPSATQWALRWPGIQPSSFRLPQAGAADA